MMSDHRRAELIAKLVAARARGSQAEAGTASSAGGVLGSAQRRFWISEQLSRFPDENTVTLVLEVDAAIDPERLTSAARALVDRHSVLGTRVGASPVGATDFTAVPSNTFTCSMAVPSGADHGTSPRDWYLRIAEASQRRGTSLRHGPLLTMTVASWSPDASAVVMSIAHAVTDAYSNAVLLEELCALYDDRPLGPPVPYSVVVAAEARLSARRSLAVARDVEYLAGAELGSLLPSPADGLFVWHHALLPAVANDRVRELARTEHASEFMVLLGVIGERLAAACAVAEPVMGISVNVREELGVTGAVGPCLEAVAFRAATGSEPGWPRVQAAVRAARDRVYEILEQGVAPYDEVLARTRQSRTEGLDRLFDVMVNHVRGESPEFTVAGAPARLLDTPVGASEMALTVSVGPVNGSWQIAAVSRGEAMRPFCQWIVESVMAALACRDLGAMPVMPGIPRAAEETGPGGTGRFLSDDEVSRRLRGCWEQILDCAVGEEDNIFRLGADSLSIARFCAAARRQGIEVSVRDVMRNPAVASLVRHGRYRVRPDVAVPRRPAPLSFPLSQGQLGMVYATERDPARRIYCSVIHAECHGDWDPGAMTRAVNSVAAVHAILRTAYGVTERVPTQCVHDPLVIEVDVRQAETVPRERRAALLAAILEEAATRRYDWFTPPLAKFTAVHWGTRRFALVIACHHSILDGQSERLLIDYLLAAYQRALATGDSTHVFLQADYRGYVEAELHALSSPAQLEFWCEEMKQILQASASERPVARAQAVESAGSSWQVPAQVADRLRANASTCGLPLKTLLIAAHCTALAQLCGTSQVVTGLSTHNRLPVADGESVLGNFVNMVPFRIGVGQGWQENAAAVFEHESVLADFSRIPLATIQRVGGARRPFWNSVSYTRFEASPGAVQGLSVFAESVVTSMLSEDGLHVNFNEMPEGALGVRVRLGPGGPAPAEVSVYRSLLETIMRSMCRD